MKMIHKYSISLGVVLLFAGCGGGSLDVPSHLKQNFDDSIDMNFDVDPKLSFYNSKDIRYKKASDENIAFGEGLLSPFFDKVFEKVLKNKDFKYKNNQLLVAINTKGYSAKQNSFAKELQIYIDKNSEKLEYKFSKEERQKIKDTQKEYKSDSSSRRITNLKSDKPDLIFDINFRGSGETLVKVIPGSGYKIYFEEKIDINNLINSLQSKWATVDVPDNMGNIDTYYILRRAVSEAEYYKNKDGGSKYKSATNINFAKAKEYCSSLEKGSSLATIYVYEHARREGLIHKPYTPGNEEMVEGYSEFDEKYCIDKDILSLRQKKYNKNCQNAIDIDEMAEDDESIEISGNELILFDWDRYEYWGASKNHTGANITFRCIKK